MTGIDPRRLETFPVVALSGSISSALAEARRAAARDVARWPP